MNRLTNQLGLNLNGNGPIVASAAEDHIVAQTNDGPLLVVSSVPGSVPQNNIGPSTGLGKKGHGRTPKLNRGPKKVWGRLAMYAYKKGPRGRPKPVPTYTMSLRPWEGLERMLFVTTGNFELIHKNDIYILCYYVEYMESLYKCVRG